MTNGRAPRRNFVSSFFRFLWGVITWTRTLVFNLIFLAIVILIIVSFNPTIDLPQPKQTPLVIAPSGNLVDQLSYTSPEAQLFGGANTRPQETLLRDLISVIEFAGNDSRITGLILKLDYLRGGGISKLEELGRAIDKFKNTGKPVIATADNLSQNQYFLASYADEIYLNNMGHISITGFGIYRNYFKDALDKLLVKFHVFKVGEYKDFVEPYIRNDMSEQSKEHNKLWLEQLWLRYTSHIEKRRDLVTGRINEVVNNMTNHLGKTQGDTAQLAFDLNLVDHLGSRIQLNKFLIDKFGRSENDENKVRQISYQHYSRYALNNISLEQANIALIVAKGNILDGQQPEGNIGGDTLSQLIREARSNKHIKALVLRIDSGGGSAFASEVIRDELEATKAAGIPIVVSYGSVAASGGYWISLAADEVWSTPSTITGSIGVFGLFPTIENSLNKLGIHSDGVGTTKLAGSIRLDGPLSTEAENILQLGVESIYSRFVKLVSESRELSMDEVYNIAGGRVWTGTKAKELGLVDKIGYLDDAIASAAAKAGLKTIEVELIERELGPKEQLLRELLKEAQVASWITSVLGLNHSSLSIVRDAIKEHTLFINAGPSSGFAVCLECIAP